MCVCVCVCVRVCGCVRPVTATYEMLLDNISQFSSDSPDAILEKKFYFFSDALFAKEFH